jgi:DNA-binding transcriptional ArsR family regulator
MTIPTRPALDHFAEFPGYPARVLWMPSVTATPHSRSGGLHCRPVCDYHYQERGLLESAMSLRRLLMAAPFEDLAAFDRLVHEPSRLAILTALSACDRADFLFLLNITGLTKGNLSSHLSKLQQARLVEIEKKFEGKQPITYIMLTTEGKEALKEYWKRFDKVRQGIKSLRPLRAT